MSTHAILFWLLARLLPRLLIFLLSFALLWATSLQPKPALAEVNARIVYVKPNAPDGASGNSWSNARSLQGALTNALVGDEIWVMAGVYYPGATAASTFMLKSGVALYGGFAGTENALTQRNPQSNLTILSGDIGKDDTVNAEQIVIDTINLVGVNAVHVVTANGVDASARLDGFVVTAGSTSIGVFGCPGGCGGGIYVNGGAPTLANLTLSGNLAEFGGGIYLGNNSSATLTNVTWRNNYALIGGGGLYNDASIPKLNNVTFDDNGAQAGGAVYNNSSIPTFITATFNRNQAEIGNGGGLYSMDSVLLLTAATFVENEAHDSVGGALFDMGSTLTFTDVVFTRNRALDGTGGAMALYNGSYSIKGGNFEENQAKGGGAIYNENNTPTLTDIHFVGNRAVGDSSGGAIYNYLSNAQLNNIHFRNNRTEEGSGGALYNSNSPSILTAVTFIGNQADNELGGGMFISGNPPTLTDVIFTRNRARLGGGIGNYSSPLLTNVVFSGNYATDRGGGIVSYGGKAILINVLFSGNHATFNGGGIWGSHFHPRLTNVTFSGNRSAGGGGFYGSDSFPILQNVIMWGNIPNSTQSNSSGPFVSYSLLEGENAPGTGNLNGTLPANNPLFVRQVNCGSDGCGDNPATPADESANDDYGDLRLLPTSPAIDVGNNDADLDGTDPGAATIATIIRDFAGLPRNMAAKSLVAKIDMGAYEAQPSAHAGGPHTINEGSTVALDGSASANTGAIVSYTWDCTNDGTAEVTATTPTGSTCSYANDGLYTLRLTLTSNTGTTHVATTTVTVANVAPLVTAVPNQSSFAGSATDFMLGSFSDPGDEGTWAVTVNWGDSSPQTQFNVNSAGALPNSNHSYASTGNYNVVVTVNDGKASHSSGFQIAVNPPGTPNVTAPLDQQAVVGVEKAFQLGSFSDQGSPGPWQITIKWGNANATESTFDVASSGALPTRTHTYDAAGTYEVEIIVSDGLLSASAHFRVIVSLAAEEGILFLPGVGKGN